ncbi:MAG: hypothetical protein LAQ69_15205 [Acidobacteriia bacterium]|nr:hypothetical protein [Terriglobia bacterium]
MTGNWLVRSCAAAAQKPAIQEIVALATAYRGRSRVLTDLAVAAAGILPGAEPTGPESLPIQIVHRHPDGVITFHRKNTDGGFENLFAIRAEHLQGMFPEFRRELEKDSYFSINAFWHPQRQRARIKATEARRSDRLRYLCACYCDVDCHKNGVRFGTAFGVILNYQDEGRIPPASVIVRSGRGLWLLFLLRDHDPKCASLPQRAFPEKVRDYLEINRAAGERLANIEADALAAGAQCVPLGIDTGAHDTMRITRVPGSINTKALEYPRVKYWVQCGIGGNPITYTLDQLGAAFGVKLKVDPASERAFAATSLSPGSRKRGPTGMNMRRLRDFGVLRSRRGAFASGCRNNALMVYSLLLRANGAARDAVLEAVSELGCECNPPIEPSAARNAVKSVFSRTDTGSYRLKWVKDQSIANLLEIRPEEADLLEQLPCASNFQVVDMQVIQPISPERRRLLIRKLIEIAGAVPTCRAMVTLLMTEGHNISPQQVVRDYRALGIETGREKSGTLLFP